MSALYYALRNQVRGRKSHTYCVGAAKTGTTSLALIMSQAIRSAHEPLVTQTNDLVISYLNNELTKTELHKELKRRDRELFLEFESSHQLGYFASELAEVFPESKFLVTIREPKKWLKSRLNFHFERKPPEWEKYRNFIWSRHKQPYAKCEKVLEEFGLFPLASYLAQYTEQYTTVFEGVDSDRLMVLKTEQIDDSLSKVALFTNVQNVSLQPMRANELKLDKNIIDSLPVEFVDEQIEKYTSGLKEYI